MLAARTSIMSAERLRLFVAMDISGDARELLSETIESFRHRIEGARWVKAQNLHMTLKFIGDYGEEGMERLSNEIRATAERCRAFRAALGGCGAFPSPGKARVLWVGMHEGGEEAGAVARKLDSRLEKVGIKRENRPFRGHLTLARMKRPGDCAAYLEDMGDRLEGLRDMVFDVGEIVLYRSVLSPQGPTYTALERAGLKGTGIE
jgi:2'-5' RNA ligase